MVLADEVVAHAFSHGFKDDHTPRLAAYLEEALGVGPATYTEPYGVESEVIWIHSGNGEHTDMDSHRPLLGKGADRPRARGLPKPGHTNNGLAWLFA